MSSLIQIESSLTEFKLERQIKQKHKYVEKSQLSTSTSNKSGDFAE